MKKVRQLAHHFFYNIAFVKKMIFLFCIGILVPMIFQQTVYYLETERGIKERMLATVNEALDDKTLKITSVLSETAALEKRYSTNETLYQCLDKKYTKGSRLSDSVSGNVSGTFFRNKSVSLSY